MDKGTKGEDIFRITFSIPGTVGKKQRTYQSKPITPSCSTMTFSTAINAPAVVPSEAIVAFRNFCTIKRQQNHVIKANECSHEKKVATAVRRATGVKQVVHFGVLIQSVNYVQKIRPMLWKFCIFETINEIQSRLS